MFYINSCSSGPWCVGMRNPPARGQMPTYCGSCLSSSFLKKQKMCLFLPDLVIWSLRSQSNRKARMLFLCLRGNVDVCVCIQTHACSYRLPNTQMHQKELGAGPRNCVLIWNYLQSLSTSLSFPNRLTPGPAIPLFLFLFPLLYIVGHD